MKFQSIKTSELNKKQIDQILNLKNTYSKYEHKAQLKWFKKNALVNDLHNLFNYSNILLILFLNFQLTCYFLNHSL